MRQCVCFFSECVCVSTAGDQQRRAEWVMRGGGGDPGCWGPVWQGDWQTGARAVYTLRDPPFRDPGLCYQGTGLQVSMRSLIASLLHYYYNTKVFIIHLGLIVFSLFPFLGQSSFQEGQPLCMQKMPPGSTRPYSPWESLSLGFVMGCRYVCTCMHKQIMWWQAFVVIGLTTLLSQGFCSRKHLWFTHSAWVATPYYPSTPGCCWALQGQLGLYHLLQGHFDISWGTRGHYSLNFPSSTSCHPFCGTFLQTVGSCSIFGFALKRNLCVLVLTRLCVCVTDDE